MVALARSNLQALAVLLSDDADGTITPVGIEIRRLVSDEVTAADQVVQLIERLSQSHDVAGEHDLASAALREHFQDSVGIRLVALIFAGADGIYGYARPFGRLDALFEAAMALVILSVAEDH